MRINNNLMAMNTHRQLGMANAGGAKSMEKLSSGFRINRAGDDAAGLAISEKMRGQIRGLDQASSNAQNGISLIQTAEGALNETHAILQRMRELAVQSSTDTNTDADRENIQDEINELTAEVSRIAETTEFNTMKLLDGKYTDKKFHIGANEGQNITFDVDDMGAKALGLESAGKFTGKEAVGNGMGDVTVTSTNEKIKSVVFAENAAGSEVEVKLENGKLTVTAGQSAEAKDINKALEEYGVSIDPQNEVAIGTIANGADVTIELEQVTTKVGDIGKSVANISDKSITKLTVDTNGVDDAVEVTKNNDGEVTVKIGKDVTLKQLNESLKEYGISIESTDKSVNEDTKAGTVSNGTFDIDAGKSAIKVDTQPAADKAITTVNSALETVSKQRSKLGAVQNRLEHTIKNLDTSAENLQASESRIRDVDMAKEMMEQTKNNILQQASTAMLAQANMAPQSVLQLLG